MSLPLWPHQEHGLANVRNALSGGGVAVAVTSPTGGGKARMIMELIRERRERTVVYTNRKLLLEMLRDTMEKSGIHHGIRASGYEPRMLSSVQISSLQTENARVYGGKKKWALHDAKLVIIDEAHAAKAGVAQRIINEHKAAGAKIVGFTATPVDIGHIYQKLIVAGNNTSLRECGAHVPAQIFAPDEPDSRRLKRTKTGEFERDGLIEAIMTPTIFGRVYEHWKKLNPDARPTILFAPGVAESLYFAKEFHGKGVSVAHIDGKDIWLNGHEMESDRQTRNDVLGCIRRGEVQVVCNRFVLREAVDIPELYCGILATSFGSIQTYLQSSGRLLRNHPSLPGHVRLIDHGGNVWRHGSINADREWDMASTDREIVDNRLERIREKPDELVPIVCPRCKACRLSGPECWQCGYKSKAKTRFVVQLDGTLRQVGDPPVKKRKVSEFSDTQKRWDRCYFRVKSRGGTFKQALGLFYKENKYWPPSNLFWMPVDRRDMERKISDVGGGKLRYPDRSPRPEHQVSARVVGQQEIHFDA